VDIYVVAQWLGWALGHGCKGPGFESHPKRMRPLAWSCEHRAATGVPIAKKTMYAERKTVEKHDRKSGKMCQLLVNSVARRPSS
jgi:hypothetical protein